MLIKRIGIVLLSLAAFYTGRAQLVFNSVEEVWKYADQHSIAIQTAKHEIDKSDYTRKQAYDSLLPKISANGTYTDNLSLQTTLIPAEFLGGQPGTYFPVQFGQQYVYAGSITAQAPLLNLQNWFSVRIARQTEEMNKDSLASARKNIYQQIANQYYSYLLMQEAARIADQTTTIADSVFQLTNNKFQQGSINQADVDNAKLNFERAQQTQITADYQMAVAKNNIKSLLGLSVNDSIQFSASLQNNLQVDTGNSFQTDPSIQMAWHKAQISLSQYKQANSAFAPTLNILYSYTQQRFDNTFEPFTNAKDSRAWFLGQYWGLQLNVPIFNGGYRLYQSKKSKITYKENMDLYESAKKQSAINDENIKLNYQKAVAVLDKAKDVMDLSFDNYQHISYRYDAGVAALGDRLNAFKDYIDYQNQYLNSLSDMLVQLYQIKIREQSF
jgi:outer membrane protein